jgi:threonine/homoserine/homoserine lactone efflux protein
VIIGLLAIPAVALCVGALILPPGIAFSLVRRGLSEGRTSWTALGIACGLVWLLLLWGVGRKVFGRQRSPRAEDGGDGASG